MNFQNSTFIILHFERILIFFKYRQNFNIYDLKKMLIAIQTVPTHFFNLKIFLGKKRIIFDLSSLRFKSKSY